MLIDSQLLNQTSSVINVKRILFNRIWLLWSKILHQRISIDWWIFDVFVMIKSLSIRSFHFCDQEIIHWKIIALYWFFSSTLCDVDISKFCLDFENFWKKKTNSLKIIVVNHYFLIRIKLQLLKEIYSSNEFFVNV